jgi:hypothetical protein
LKSNHQYSNKSGSHLLQESYVAEFEVLTEITKKITARSGHVGFVVDKMALGQVFS